MMDPAPADVDAGFMFAGHGMTVTFRDWVQDIGTWGECKRAKPSPC
jgi:hypothetical protein